MTRRKRKGGAGKGQGGGGRKHPNSLANLRPLTGPPVGNTHAMTHGYRSRLLVQDVAAETAELASLLAKAAPVKDTDGTAPLADTTAIEVAAVALRRWRSVHTWCEMHGRIDDKGEVKPAAHYELQGEQALHRALDVLGMNPASRSRLGLNLARAQSFDLARAWADEDVIDGEASDA
jgi:hypothetical protein